MNLYVRRLGEELGRRGLQVDLFTRRTEPHAPDVIEVDRGVRLVHLRAGPPRRLPRSALPLHIPALVSAFRSFVEGEKGSYDLIHSHYWVSGLAAVRYRAMTRDPVPVIHMFHTLAKVKEFYLGRPDSRDTVLRADGERCVLRRADVIVGCTETEIEEITRLYGAAPNSHAVIPPGVDLNLFRPHDPATSRRLLGLTGKRVVLFVGRDDPLKGLDTLLHAVAGLDQSVRQELQLVLVGGHDQRPDRSSPRTRKLIARLGLEGRIELRGRVLQDKLPLYYSAADICAVPSAHETFGMVATEAMACQTPVVAFKVGGLTDTILDRSTGFLARPGDVRAYRDALVAALHYPDLASMGRRARLSLQRLNWDAVADQTVDLYDEALARYRSTWLPLSASR